MTYELCIFLLLVGIFLLLLLTRWDLLRSQRIQSELIAEGFLQLQQSFRNRAFEADYLRDLFDEEDEEDEEAL